MIIDQQTCKEAAAIAEMNLNGNSKPFVNQHVVLPQHNDDQNLQKIQKQQLKKVIAYYIRTLCLLFQEIVSKQMYHHQPQLLRKLDDFGYALFMELQDFNFNRRLINKLTLQVFDEKILFKEILATRGNMIEMQMQIKYVLFRLAPLQMAVSQICGLYIKLFYQNDSFKKEITISYIQNYANIRYYNLTKYHNFAHQLFNNSYLIQQLCLQKTLPIFMLDHSLQRQVARPSRVQEINTKYKQLNQQMRTFLNDIHYFLLLIPQCACTYWNYFVENKGFLKLGQCLQMFKEEWYLKCNKGQTYFQEEILVRFVDILNLLTGDFGFMQRTLSQLYEIISLASQKSNPNERPNIKGFSMIYQRMWALTSYLVMITKPIKSINIFTLISDQKPHKEVFRVLYQYNKMKNPESAATVITAIFDKVLTYFSNINFLQLNHQYQIQNRRIFRLYFCSVNFLYSIDSIIFQLCLKFMYYLSDLNKQNEAVSIKNTLAAKINKYFIQNQSLNSNNVVFTVKRFMKFMGMISEVLFSDLADIILSTKFSAIRQTNPYQDAYIYYFKSLYNSLTFSSKLKQEDFMKVLSDSGRIILFYEQSVIKYCCSKPLQMDKKYEINFDYFCLLQYKVMNKLKNVSLNKINFFFKNPHTNFIYETAILESFKSFMKQSTYFLEKISELKNIINISNMKQSQAERQFFNKLKQKLNKVSINQLKKLSVLTKNQQLQNQFNLYQERIYGQNEQYWIQEKQSLQNNQFHFLSIDEQNQIENDSSQGLSKQVSIQSVSEVMKVAQFNQGVFGQNQTCGMMCNKGKEVQLSLLCSIGISRFFNNFGIQSGINYIFFSTCFHCVHDTCIQQYKLISCPICKNSFDFTFLNYTSKNAKEAQQAYTKFSNDITKKLLNKINRIQTKLEKPIQSVLKSSSQQTTQQQKLKSFIFLFQSVIIFILKAFLIKNKSTYINDNINIYKNLFLYMLKYVIHHGNTESLNNAINQTLFKNLKVSRCHQIVKRCIITLGQILFSSFQLKKNNNDDGETFQNLYIDKHLSQKQEIFITRLFEVFTKAKESPYCKNIKKQNNEQIAHAKMGQIHIKYFFKIEQIALSHPMTKLSIQLPATLFELQEKYKGNCSKKCINHKKQNKCLFIQFIRQQQYPQNLLKCCILCIKQTMIQYSLQKRSQLWMIRSDTGQICQFRVGDAKLKTVAFKSIYLNSLGQVYVQAENLLKKQYYLDKMLEKNIQYIILLNNTVQQRKFMMKTLGYFYQMLGQESS